MRRLKRITEITNGRTTKHNPIKISFIITGMGTGGAEMMLFKLLSRINRDKFSPSVISLVNGGVFEKRFKALNIPVYSLGLKRGIPNPIGIFKLKKILNLTNPDLIQGWMYHANFLALIVNLTLDRRIPVLWSIHHSVNSLKNEKLSLRGTIKLTAIFSKYVSQVIFSSQIGKVQHLKLGYGSSNALTINDSFDLSSYKPSYISSFNLREFLSIPKNSILIGSLARYHPMKDHLNIIEGAYKILTYHPRVHFILAGPGIDNNNPTLIQRINQIGIKNRVHLIGEIENVAEFMSSLNIFTSSSAFGESFPNVIGEAMVCETPCVVTDVGDSKLIVGDTGFVIPPQDSGALVEAWEKLISLGKVGQQNLGKKARTRIEQKFDLDSPKSFVKKYEKIYKKLLSKL